MSEKLPMDDVLFQAWETAGLPEEGKAEIELTKTSVETVKGRMGTFEKVRIDATVLARPNGGVVGEKFQTDISLDPQYLDKFRDLVAYAELPTPSGAVTRQDIHEMVKALEGVSVWTDIKHVAGKDGKTRPFLGFKFAKTYEELVG